MSGGITHALMSTVLVDIRACVKYTLFMVNEDSPLNTDSTSTQFDHMDTIPLDFRDSAPGPWCERRSLPSDKPANALDEAERLAPLLSIVVRPLLLAAIAAERGNRSYAGVELDSAAAFRNYCYVAADRADLGPDRFKVRTGYRQWTAGMYLAGFGCLIAHGADNGNCWVLYRPWLDEFFLDSHQDARRIVPIPRSVWDCAFAAGKIAAAGAGVASVKPFSFNGQAWITTSASYGGNEPPQAEAWSLCPIAQWGGPTYSYATHHEAINLGHAERSDYRGIIVKVRRDLYVVDQGMTVFEPSPNTSAYRPKAQPSAAERPPTLDVDGTPLFDGARCVIVDVPHPQRNNELGSCIIVAKLAGEQVWTYKDEPLRYRTNRAGRQVIAHDPKCIQSLYMAAELRLADITMGT